MKKGFTLIELMVVIVIIGILAAIAVPKMFGMSAKARASEVGPAAGSWSKLEQAYIVETTGIGTFISIGYIPPGETKPATTSQTQTFIYTDETASGTAGWQAETKIQLNDCAKGENWNGSMTSGSGRPTFKTSKSDCLVLTPNFKDIQ